MKSSVKKLTAAITAVAAATALVACSSEPTVSAFQNPRPWQTVKNEQAYEKLDYAVAVYDAKAGTSDDKRIKIADGTLSFTLEYGKQEGTPTDGATLDMALSVTYNDAAPEKDRGKTDAITSTSTILTNSLETLTVEKHVSLAEREGVKNNSYDISADYGRGTATRTMHGNTKKLKLDEGKYWDNESMYYLARTTNIKKGASTTFYMTNLFDSFERGEVEQLTMAASAESKLTQLPFDEWISPYVITKEQEDAEKEEEKNEQDKNKSLSVAAENDGGEADGEQPYTVPCYRVGIVMAVDERGPDQVVYYCERPIENGGLRHKKVPLKMTYALYTGGKVSIQYEYTLTGLSFVKQ